MKKLSILIAAIFAILSVSRTALAWNNPTANPTGGAGVIYAESGATANSLYIKSNGNVGVGTTSPIGQLDVRWPLDWPSAQAIIAGTASQNPSLRLYRPTGTGSNSYIWYLRAGGSAVSNLEFISGSSTAIGTDTLSASPALILKSNGDATVSGTLTASGFSGPLAGSINASNVSSGSFGGSQGGGVYGFPDKLSVGYGLNSTPTTLSQSAILAVSGNVGVGTATPAARLHVDGGDIKLADIAAASAYTIKGYNNGSSLWFIGAAGQKLVMGDAHSWDRSASINYNAGTTGAAAGVLSIGQLDKNGATYTHGITDFYTNGLARMRIDALGSVGIGTTAPSSKLEVVGSVLAKSGTFRTSFPGTSTQAYHAELSEDYGDASRPIRLRFHQGSRYWVRIEALDSQFYFKTGDTASESYVPVNTGNLNVNGNGYVSGNLGVGVAAPTAGLDVRKAVTASAGVANGTNLQQTLTAAANNDVLSALRVNPTFTVGAFTGVTQYAINATGTIKATSFEGALSGTTSAANVSSGAFGANTGGGNYSFPANLSITNDGGALKLYGTGGAGTHVYTEYYPGGSAAGRYAWTGFGGGGSQDFAVMNQRPTGNIYLGTNGVNQLAVLSSGNVGIGTISPAEKLHVNGLIAIPLATATDNDSPGIIAYGSSNDDFLYDGEYINHYGFGFHNYDDDGAGVGAAGINSYVAGYFGIDFFTGGVNRMRIRTGGNVGIGVVEPAYKLDVASAGATTARIGSASTDTVFIGGGSGKLNVGTIDPIYTIGGKRYATYTSAMTGVKEETSGTTTLKKTGSGYFAELNIKSAKEGGDLWLFYQVTDFGEDWDKLSILLSPSFEGSTWYEKDPTRKTIRIYGEPKDSAGVSMEVSYRLTAPRFDHKKWSNRSTDEADGFKIDVKE